MKNAMKKLMSLLLVALLLVGVMPFGASAVEPGNVSFAVKVGDSNEAVFAKEGTISGESTTVKNLLTYWYGSADASATYNVGGDAGSYANLTLADLAGITVTPGQHVVVRVHAAVQPEQPQPEQPQPEQPQPEQPQPEQPQPEQPQPVVETLKFQIRVDESDAVVFAKEATLKNGESTTVNNLIKYWAGSNGFDVTKYNFDHYYSTNDGKTYYNADNTVYAGDIITIRMMSKNTTPDAGTSDNVTNSNTNNGVVGSNDAGYYKISGKVKLWVILGGVTREYDIKTGIAADGKVTLNEVKSVVKNYYNAVDTDTGIVYDGIYPQQGNFYINYALDQKYDTVDGLYYAANNSDYVVLKVFISNATVASTTTYTADTSNPKTGDNIYTAMTVMGVSAASLAAVMYFYNKKRMAL